MAFPQVGGGANLLFALSVTFCRNIFAPILAFPPQHGVSVTILTTKTFTKTEPSLKMKHFGIFVPLFRGIDGKLANRSFFLLSVTSGKKIEGGEQICRLCLAPGKNLLTCGRKSVFRGGSKNFFAPGNRPVGMGSMILMSYLFTLF